MLPKNLIFLTTLRCPLECQHCIVDSNPRRQETIELGLLERLIEEANELGVSTIGFTGGDPFIRRSELLRATNRAIELGMRVIVISSAFWARSLQDARRVLEPFSKLYMLGLSTDGYHQRFTSLDHIRNAIRAAKEYSISRIEIQITYLNPADLQATQKSLEDVAEGVIFRGQRLWPVGRAAPLVLGQEEFLTPLEAMDMTCPMGPPVITPDLKVKGCCSSLLNLGDSNPIILGDLSNESLSQVLYRSVAHSYYLFIKNFGLGPLVELLRSSSFSRALHPAYADVCHLCHHIHSNDNVRQFLVQEITEALHSTNPREH